MNLANVGGSCGQLGGANFEYESAVSRVLLKPSSLQINFLSHSYWSDEHLSAMTIERSVRHGEEERDGA